MKRYEVDADLGGENEVEAVVTIKGSDASVLDLLGRMHIWIRNERERIKAERPGRVEPCRGCGN